MLTTENLDRVLEEGQKRVRDREDEEGSEGPGASIVISVPPPLERVPSTTGFKTVYLKRSTVVRIARLALIFTITCVCVFTGLCIYGLAALDVQQHSIAWYTGGIAVAIAVPVSIHDILMHMLHYVRPELQKFYIRILWMVPVYAVESWLALRFKSQALWLETCREAYEAYVIYAFFKLMLEFLGGSEGLQRKLALKNREHPHMLFPFNRVTSWTYKDGRFLQNCRIGIWAYVVVRVVCAIIMLVIGNVEEGGEGSRGVDLFVVVLINLAQLVAMYCLVLFYHDLYEELAPLKPLGKFLSVKAVVFFSFWQGLVIRGLVEAHVITEKGDYSTSSIASGLQDWLLCWEMAIAALAHRQFFSYKDFSEHFNVLSDQVRRSQLKLALADMVPHDLAQETAHHVEHVKKALPTLPHPSLPTLTLRHSKDEKAEKAGPTTAEGAVEMTDAAWKKAVHETRPPTQAGGSVDQGPIPPGLGHAETDATVDLTPQGSLADAPGASDVHEPPPRASHGHELASISPLLSPVPESDLETGPSLDVSRPM